MSAGIASTASVADVNAGVGVFSAIAHSPVFAAGPQADYWLA